MFTRTDIIIMIAEMQPLYHTNEKVRENIIKGYSEWDNTTLIIEFNKNNRRGLRLQKYGDCFVMEFDKVTELYCIKTNMENVSEKYFSKADIKHRLLNNIDIK
jgi:hypothetical protein